ncbi:MAG TPA: phage portal protein, partial [Trueperaceae bacterium]|nr:phage portal protein [Trueperaceae bacterium]
MSLLRWIAGARSETGARTADLLSDDKWLIDALGGRVSSSGKRVRGQQALTLDGYYACVRNIAEDLGKMTREVRKRLEDGGSEKITKGNAVRLIRRRASPSISDQAFVEAMALSALHRGFGLAEIQRDRDSGEAIRMWPIHAGLVEIKEDAGGVYALVHGFNGNPAVVIPWEDMFYIHG